MCQCPLGLIPHFYGEKRVQHRVGTLLCQCPLGLIPHFYTKLLEREEKGIDVVSMPSRAYTSFLHRSILWVMSLILVSMPSRAYTSFLRQGYDKDGFDKANIVSMPSRAYTSFLLCSLASSSAELYCGVNALSGLYLISTVPLQKPRFYAVSRACFCRYLSEYSDNSRFLCMLTFWTYLMRCTYP